MEHVVIWFNENLRLFFYKSYLREDQDGRLILWKWKVLFTNFPGFFDKSCGYCLQKYLREEAGLRVDVAKEREMFPKKAWEGRSDYGLISLNVEIFFFVKWSHYLDHSHARSDGQESQSMWHNLCLKKFTGFRSLETGQNSRGSRMSRWQVSY